MEVSWSRYDYGNDGWITDSGLRANVPKHGIVVRNFELINTAIQGEKINK